MGPRIGNHEEKFDEEGRSVSLRDAEGYAGASRPVSESLQWTEEEVTPKKGQAPHNEVTNGGTADYKISKQADSKWGSSGQDAIPRRIF